jgi:hypothetical protein
MSLQQIFDLIILVINGLFSLLGSLFTKLFDAIWTSKIYLDTENGIGLLICVVLVFGSGFGTMYLDKMMSKAHDELSPSAPGEGYNINNIPFQKKMDRYRKWRENLMGLIWLSIISGLVLGITFTPPTP